MGKKNKNKDDDGGPPGTIPNRDLMQRMSFLLQASVCLQNAAGAQQGPSAGEMRRLARKHVKTLKGIASGAVVKVDPSVKRVLCKKCSLVLIPGSTASVRVKTSGPHGKIVSYTCFSCNERRVIPAPPTKRPGNPAQDTQVRRSKARPEPFFARADAGHVLFSGTERVACEN